MGFRIKNISTLTMDVLGISMEHGDTVDLLDYYLASTIISSLMSGELYDLLYGRMIIIPHPTSDIADLNLSTAQFDFISKTGFLKAFSGNEDIKPPFKFGPDGYLLTTATIGSITVESQSEVEGRVLDGASAAGIKPIIVSGVDANGNSQALFVTSDGYLMTDTVISVETSSEVEGRVLDGASAAGIKPIIVAGADGSGNAQTIYTGPDGYVWTRTQGLIADGNAATNIYPNIVGGIDENGNVQSLLVSTDGEANITGYDAAQDAVRTFETAPLNFYFTTETLVNTTNLAVATYYYTTNMDNYTDISFEIEVSTNITLTVEASNDAGFSVPKDITKTGNELTTNASGYVSFTNGSYILDYDNFNVSNIRIKAVVANATNTLKIVDRKKAL